MTDRRVAPPLSTRAYRGQTLVFFAVVSTVLLGILGLVLDAGYDYSRRRAMQNAADAAALAGASAVAKSNQPSPPSVIGAVDATAQRNGVTDLSANRTCTFINDSGTVVGPNGGDCTAAVPSGYGITGVQVTVKEQHDTFMIKVLGINTAGTGATAAARVNIVTALPGNLTPFMVCGINTDLTIPLTNGATTLPILLFDSSNKPYINDLAYGLELTNGGLPVKPLPIDASHPDNPTFLIHGPQIDRCNAKSNNWKGQIEPDSPMIDIDPNAGTNVSAEEGTRTGPTADIAAVGGCKANQSNNCIMILPIADQSGPGGSGSKVVLKARVWGMFYVTDGPGSNEHKGQLVKANLNIASNGTVGWTPSYRGPISIRLIR